MPVQNFMACFACIIQLVQTGFNILDENAEMLLSFFKLEIYTPPLTQFILKNPVESHWVTFL